MKINPLLHRLLQITVLGLVCNFTFTATAQNYYPANIGNEWNLESTNGKQKRTYTLETPEDAADQEYTLLKIVTEKISSGEVTGIDNYFITTDNEGIKLHKTVITIADIADIGDITANFPTPILFFPDILVEGDKWQIVADATLLGGELSAVSTTDLEIVAFEDVVTPVGTFQNCAKIQLTVNTSAAGGLIDLGQTTSYQWLAPDLGPIKYETHNGIVFEMVNFKLSGPPEIAAQNRPVWQLPSQVFQVTGSRLGGLLNAKILENVEDYASEVGNLGIEAVTGGIVPPGDGTGFATNSQRKQDLWVAGILENTPIIGTITLFAENNRGRSTVTIEVSIR